MPNTLGQRDGYKMCVSTESFNTVITLTHFIYFWATQVMCRRRSQTVPIPEERKKNQSYFCTIPPFKNKHFCYFHQSSFFFCRILGDIFRTDRFTICFFVLNKDWTPFYLLSSFGKRRIKRWSGIRQRFNHFNRSSIEVCSDQSNDKTLSRAMTETLRYQNFST